MGDSINVETGELNNFARDVRSGTDGGLRPAVSHATVSLGGGVMFGLTNASGVVHAAKFRYADSLRASMANLQEFVEAAKIMADAAERVAAEFDAVDARSAQAVQRVNDVLFTATQDAAVARLARQRPQHPQYGPYGQAEAV